MIRTGIGIILGLVALVIFQVIQIHEKKAISDALESGKWASVSRGKIEPLMGHYSINGNYSEYIGVQSTRFEPYTEEYEPGVLSNHNGENSAADYPEKRKRKKFIKFLFMLKFAGDSCKGISYRSSF